MPSPAAINLDLQLSLGFSKIKNQELSACLYAVELIKVLSPVCIASSFIVGSEPFDFIRIKTPGLY